jgi:hypothetical protein
MKAHVLMSRKTGDLFEGYRICFVAAEQRIHASAMYGWAVSLIDTRATGWIAFHPRGFGPWGVFFNAEGVEELFEDLGEL